MSRAAYAQLGPKPGQTVAEARTWIREHEGDGALCPVCGQLAKVYRRGLHAGMAAKLIVFYKAFGLDWGSRVTLFAGGAEGDFAKLAHWGLIAESDETRPDGGRAGWWRVTLKGQAFVAGDITVPRFVHLFDGRPVRPADGWGATFAGPQVSIRACLGKRFNYNELMGLAI